jgi:NAD(P)-dependent dehydrogenase (short-subunit alcohol dehydrogenase family)
VTSADATRPRLGGKTVLVTGASSGIGLAIANLFADRGAKIHGASRRPEAIEEGVGDRRLSEADITAHRLDVTRPEGVDRLVGEIAASHGLDVLVCAAGTNLPERRLGQLTPEAWDNLVATNLSGIFYCVRAALPYLRTSHGLVILIGSVSGIWPDLSGPAYQATKAGVAALAHAIMEEERTHGIRTSVIYPGLTDTPLVLQRPVPIPAETLALALQPEDIATACTFVMAMPERTHIPELLLYPRHI